MLSFKREGNDNEDGLQFPASPPLPPFFGAAGNFYLRGRWGLTPLWGVSAFLWSCLNIRELVDLSQSRINSADTKKVSGAICLPVKNEIWFEKNETRSILTSICLTRKYYALSGCEKNGVIYFLVIWKHFARAVS
jgi:hypothetical protein